MKENLTKFFTSQCAIRTAVTTALVAYPLGCLAMLLLPDKWEIVGGSLIVVSAIAFICALPSSLSRIAFVPQVFRFVDGTNPLDELEAELRRRSQAFAFQVFSVLALGGIMYLVVASDRVNAGEGNLWLPRVDDHWLAILFGALIYVLLLPLAYLAWKLPKPVVDDDPGEHAEAGEMTFRDNIVVSGMSIGLAIGVIFFNNAALWMLVGTAVGFGLDWVLRKRMRAEKGD